MSRSLLLPLAAPLLMSAMTPLAAQEDNSGPLFMKHLLKGENFFEPWGIGIDFYTADQKFEIATLDFELPGVILADPSLLEIDNNVQHQDLKLDVWLTPFLNTYAFLGRVAGDTVVDLSEAPLEGLPIPLSNIPISYDGTVYGFGATFVYGTRRWFTSLSTTWSDTSLSGNFGSSVSTISAQPKIGLVRGKWQFWVGGFFLDVDEEHSGTFNLPIPGVPPVPFHVELESASEWNAGVGVGHNFGTKARLRLELGFGDRDHTLFNFTYRF